LFIQSVIINPSVSMFHRAFFNSIIVSNALGHKVHHVHPLQALLSQHRDWWSEF